MSAVADFYDSASSRHSDFLVQVGHTASGKPISHAEFETLLANIETSLRLEPSHQLLDVCCGNGYLSSHIAQKVGKIVGVDLSAGLIEVARRHHAQCGETYHVLDALQIGSLASLTDIRFDRILLYAALQHLPSDSLERLLGGMGAIAAPSHVIMLGFVPDRALRWRFYDTLLKKLRHFGRRLRGREMIGTWWDRKAIARTAARLGYECRFEPMPAGTSGAHYRFNIILERRA